MEEQNKAPVFKDTEHLEAQFQEIKEHAWKKDKLPRDWKFTIVDERYFQTMKAMYEKYRMRLVHKADAEKEVDMLRLRYITDKTLEEKRIDEAKKDSDRRMRASQVQARLIKEGGNMSCREIFEAVFCELIPLLTNDIDGRLIREGAGFKLWTGVSGLSEEEIREIIKANKFEKEGENAFNENQ